MAVSSPSIQRFQVSGLHCASCVRRLENALKAATGVSDARVNLADSSATVAFNGTIPTAELLAAAKQTGYPMDIETDETESTDETPALLRETLIAGALVLPVFTVEMGGHLFPALHHAIARSIGLQTIWILQFLLIGLVLAWPGRWFFLHGIPTLLKGRPDMNALVALGTSAAFLYSSVVTFAPSLLPAEIRAVYFEAAGVIIVLILLGRFLEARAKGRAGEAIRALIGLQPSNATVVIDGVDTLRPIALLAPGDRLRITPGQRLPADGIVVEGKSTVDESMLTGEAMPVSKSIGDAVTGGTVNGMGSLVIEARHVGQDTVLSNIIRSVKQAQAARLPVEALVDRITAIFVPVVIAIAALTILVWLVFDPTLALPSGVAVLIVACPCAMGLAVPMSIMTGSGRAAELGVLFRKGDALQRLSAVKTLAFDKTGTLTQGAPQVTWVETVSGVDGEQVLGLAAAVEAGSEHPIGKAILSAAPRHAVGSDFQAVAGEGAHAMVEGRLIRVGSSRFMANSQIDPKTLEDCARVHEAKGETAVYVSVDNSFAGFIAVSDPLKESAHEMVRSLRASGRDIVMISGDATATANAVATRLDLQRVVAEALPDDKVAAIKRLSADGPVVFVGDGINDAPALAAANAGIAIGTGTDVAIETADVVLLSGDLTGVTRAISISEATMRNIKQNLGWAFGYNILLIPVAAGLLYPALGVLLSPMLAAAAMALSSVAVVTNSLRLRSANGELQ